MNDGFAWWLLIAGIGIGVALAWLIMGRLARADDDVDEDERAEEAAWISRSIAAYGGSAPPALVEEILELHRHYLAGPGLELSGETPAGLAAAPDGRGLEAEDASDEEKTRAEREAAMPGSGSASPRRASGES
jgi:hypothetical protein